MNRFLLFLVFLSGISSCFAQDEIEIIVEIHVSEKSLSPHTPRRYRIEFYTKNDTFNLITNPEGKVYLTSKDPKKIIAINQDYHFIVYKGDKQFGQDKFSTRNISQNTKIIRAVKAFSGCATITFPTIAFIGNTLSLSPQGKHDFELLSLLLEEEEGIVLEFRGQTNTAVNGLLAIERAHKIRDSLIFEGHYPDRLKINKPIPSEGEACVEFGILSFDYFPCTGVSIINFDKTTDTIAETPCDSIHFIANYLNIQEENFAVIGIYTIKDDPVAKQKAIQRAKRVREELIALGIDEKRLRVTTSYHEEPDIDDHRDWPFYPLSYSYEIGVYVLGDY